MRPPFPRRLPRQLLSVCSMVIATGMFTPLTAQVSGADLTELGLAELLDLDVVAINALGAHTHFAGEWMFGYRYMTMSMPENLDATRGVGPAQVLESFMVSPTRMRMQMHMAEVMYAPSDNLTLMVMLPYHVRLMDHVTRNGGVFSTSSQGVGDVVAEALVTVVGRAGRDRHRLLISGRISLPTGDIDVRGTTPAGSGQLLPYPMRLGSGTVALAPGVTYLGEDGSFAWMLQARGTLQVGSNRRDYGLGNQRTGTAWLGWAIRDWVSPTLGLDAQIWGDVEGADPALNPMMVPTADPALRGGSRIDLKPGLTLYAPTGRLEGHRFSVEAMFPVHQSLHGPQLKTAWSLVAGWSWTY